MGLGAPKLGFLPHLECRFHTVHQPNKNLKISILTDLAIGNGVTFDNLKCFVHCGSLGCYAAFAV